ncbi:MAG TPA: pilus assembly protein PilP [Gammaproteobacteria bacterium]|nr:type 4a pilus biogenesis protein PilO [Pseudomonadota bacterium]HBF07047.1 pilus assembly protein PilP [Gammaproteobacteria bacterium]HCK93294.1 pilus assembly protein PilP [Gammaproteobacteria bacterium]|tara:strand:- start:1204 stop:1824 length:621 start_codon:yes stop_codon:yes gene_type:complete
MDFNEIQSNLESLDPENIGSWPLLFRIVIWIVVFLICGAAVYWFFLKNTLHTLEMKQREEATLIQSYTAKASDAANLNALKLQMAEMKQTFGALLRQLPEDTEVPGLLEDISQLGLDSGLEFESIGLGKEFVKEFYAELPIDIKVKGGYHSLATFVSGISALPRIVTLHNYTLAPTDKSNDNLLMTVTAKTYRYSANQDSDVGGVK